jgi:hypothetical protein
MKETQQDENRKEKDETDTIAHNVAGRATTNRTNQQGKSSTNERQTEDL